MKVEDSSLKKRVAVGAFWMILLKFVLRGIGLISTMILARILSPEDYGMVALGMSVYVLIEMFAAFGFDTVLVKKVEITKEDYDSAWTARLICYSILSVVFACSAPLAASFYQKEAVASIVYAFSFMMFLSGLENIAIVDFRRNLEFSKEFKLNVFVKLAGFSVTIPLAFYLENYWALVIGSISLRITSVILGYHFRPYLPSICFVKIKSVLSFSKWLLFTNLTLFLRKQTPNLILGRYSTAEEVGVYSLGAELSRFATQDLIAAMNRPIYSGYSKFSENHTDLFNNFLKVLSIQSLIILPIGFVVAALSEQVVLIILGEKWLAVVYPLSLMAIGTAIVSITSSIQYLFYVIEKPKLWFYLSIFALIIYLPQAYVMGTDKGLAGLVHAHFATAILMAILNFIVVTYVFKESLMKVVINFYRPLLSSIIVFVILTEYLIPLISHFFSSSIIVMILLLPASGVIYISALALIWLVVGRPDGAENIAIDLIKSIILKIKDQNRLSNMLKFFR